MLRIHEHEWLLLTRPLNQELDGVYPCESFCENCRRPVHQHNAEVA